MTVESDFRAMLANDAGVSALVGTRVALNAVPPGSDYPCIVFTSQHQRELTLTNEIAADTVTLDVQCWAENSADAQAVGDAVEDVIAAQDGMVVTARQTAFDAETGVHAEAITVEQIL